MNITIVIRTYLVGIGATLKVVLQILGTFEMTVLELCKDANHVIRFLTVNYGFHG